jgi:hypothetical protein
MARIPPREWDDNPVVVKTVGGDLFDIPVGRLGIALFLHGAFLADVSPLFLI